MPLTNPSFETGDLTGYSSHGNASIQTVAYGSTPPDGTYMCLIDNDTGALTTAALEAAVGIAAGSLIALGKGTPINGSAITYQFQSTVASQCIWFDWNMLSNEVAPSGTNDFLWFAVIFPDTHVEIASLADVSATIYSTSSPLNTHYLLETHWTTRGYPLGPAGTYTIMFGVMNVFDDTVTSAGLIDNLILGSCSGPAVVGGGGGGSAVCNAVRGPQLWMLSTSRLVGRWQANATRDMEIGTSEITGTGIPNWVYSTGFAPTDIPARVDGLIVDTTKPITVQVTKTVTADEPEEARNIDVIPYDDQDEVFVPGVGDLRGEKFRLEFSGPSNARVRRALWDRSSVSGGKGG